MIILGDRLLVSKVEKEEKEGFQTVEVQDSFLYKGRIEAIGDGCETATPIWNGTNLTEIKPSFVIGDIVLFAKYSPHTQTIPVGESDMKIIRMDDVLAVL